MERYLNCTCAKAKKNILFIGQMLHLDGILYHIGALGSAKSGNPVSLGYYLNQNEVWEVLPKRWRFSLGLSIVHSFSIVPYLLRKNITYGIE